MAINFKLGNEQGGTIEHGDIVESDELPDFEDERYPYLRLIDPYGATMFSYYQMAGVLPELERWAAEHPTPHLDRLLELARRCNSADKFLWLIGD